MEYHLQLFDIRGNTPWFYRTKHRTGLVDKDPGDLVAALKKRMVGDPNLLSAITEVRRRVIRYDKGRGVAVYYIRFPEDPTKNTIDRWRWAFEGRRLWVRVGKGILEGSNPWNEYVMTPGEREYIDREAKTMSVDLKWPITDPDCLSVIHGTAGPASSTSGWVATELQATPHRQSTHGGPSSGPPVVDTPIEDVDMASPIPPPFSPTISPHNPLPTTALSEEVPPTATPTRSVALALDANQESVVTEIITSILDQSVLENRSRVMPIPEVQGGDLVSEARVVFLDPTSNLDVLSAQLQSQSAMKEDGLITLRPHPRNSVAADDASPYETHRTLKDIQESAPIYLGRRGSIFGAGKVVPPCTFTQTVSPYPGSDSIFAISYDAPSGSSGKVSLDDGGVDISVFWQFQSEPPPTSRIGWSPDWSSPLSPETIHVLSQFPRSFPRVVNPAPIHGTDIAGDGHGRDVFRLLVPPTIAWHRLPDQLSAGLEVLTKRAGIVPYNDPEASVVPLAQVGRPHLIRAMTQSPAGIPQAQYHLAGEKRIWIVVANLYRHRLFVSLPKRIRACYWRHGHIFIRPDFLRKNSIPFTVCVQRPGDVVLVDGSSLYQSYDEGWNVIITVPYLDQCSNDAIHRDGHITLDNCSCIGGYSRDCMVQRRAAVLREGQPETDPGQASDSSSDAMDLGSTSSSSLTVSTDSIYPDAGISLSPSQCQADISLALDGPHAQNALSSSIEPDGPVVLSDYAKRGVVIANIELLASSSPEDLVGEVPRVLVDLTSEEMVTIIRLRTQRLAEAPPLSDEWSEANSLGTVRRRLVEVSPVRKATMGRLDSDGATLRKVQPQIFHTDVSALASKQVSWKRNQSVRFDHWDGLYALDRFQRFQVGDIDDQGDQTVFQQCWDVAAPPVKSPPSTFSEEVLARLSIDVRRELQSLPADMSAWSGDKAPPYSGGIGGNLDAEHILHLINHPLQNALAYLPQSLMMIALYHRSFEYPVDKLNSRKLENAQWEVNESSSGTIFPWGYGGHHRTLFGIHFEDAWMPSANLHVAGAPKVWLFIPNDDFRRLFDLLSPVLHPCFPFHRDLFLHPSFLIRHKIRFTVARQSVGDMVVAGSTSAHLGWNAGPNLAVAANFLDQFSVDIIRRDIMDGTQAPWPCDCGEKKIPSTAVGKGRIVNLPRHYYMSEDVNDVGSTVFEWIHRAIPFLSANANYLHTDPGRFARVWRYLHEIDIGDHDAARHDDSMSL